MERRYFKTYSIDLYDKRSDFNFNIFNFRSRVPIFHFCRRYVFISQIKRYARACPSYDFSILRTTQLSNELLEQGNVMKGLK